MDDVLTLAHQAGIRPGAVVQTLLFGEGGYSREHLLTDVAVQRRDGGDWLMMRWTPAGTTPWGTSDCGYAGYLVDRRLTARLVELGTVKDEQPKGQP